MTSQFRKWIVLNLLNLQILMIGSTLLSGCALLSPDLTEEEKYENDPVGRAALALRAERSPSGEMSYPSGYSSGYSSGSEAREMPSDQLTLGMSPFRVQALWGQPQEVEHAGDPTSGNQRWIYLNGLKRGWGTSDYRVVYFERNQVVGWENHR